MIDGIGASILSANAKPIAVSRSCYLKADTDANEFEAARFDTIIHGTIRHLGKVEINEISGKRVRDTIRVRSIQPIFPAVPQENAEEDIIHYDGSLWRVINVTKNKSTWRATAVRTGGKNEIKKNDTNSNSEPSSFDIF